MRAATSVPPPAVNGMTSRIGCLGYDSAALLAAGASEPNSAATSVARLNAFIEVVAKK